MIFGFKNFRSIIYIYIIYSVLYMYEIIYIYLCKYMYMYLEEFLISIYR